MICFPVGKFFRTRNGFLAKQSVLEAREEIALEDRAFVVAILGEAFDFGTFDGDGALILIHAAAGEDAHFDDRTAHARRQAQRRVAHIGGLFAEDRAQKLFFRRHRRFALRRHLTNEDIARINFSADVNDTCFVEVLESLFADVWNIARDFFLAEAPVSAGHDFGIPSIWIEVKTSSRTMRSEIRIESSKL